MAAGSASAQGGDPSTNNASSGQELSGPKAGFLSALLPIGKAGTNTRQCGDAHRRQAIQGANHHRFKCLTLTEAGPFLAATRSVSAPQQHIPATLTSSVKMLLSEEAACEATCLHRHLQSGDQNSFLLPHPPFLGIYTLQKPINSPALLLLVL